MVTRTQVTAKGHTSDWIKNRVADIWAFIGKTPSPDIKAPITRDHSKGFRRRQHEASQFSALRLHPQFQSFRPSTLQFIYEQKVPFERLLKIVKRLPTTPNDSSDRLSSGTLKRRRYFESLLKLREPRSQGPSRYTHQISKAVPVPLPRFPYQPQRCLYHRSQQMNFWLQFVTVPTVDTPGSLLVLHFDNGRYLFGNVSEGTQRACIEHGIRNTKAREVFLTGRVEWKNTGGLLGYVLSTGEKQAQQRAESKSKASGSSDPVINRLGLHGGPNLLHTLAVGRRFIFRQNMPLSVDEFKEVASRPGLEPTWVDDNLKVWQMGISKTPGKTTQWEQKDADDLRKRVVSLMFDSDWRTDALTEQPLKDCSNVTQVFIRNPLTRAIERYRGPRPPSPDAEPNLMVLTRKPWPGALIPSLPPASPDDTVMCYIAKSHPRRGRFNAKRAMELGIAPGKAFGQLTNGESVQAPDGTIVRPDMVLSADRPGLGVAVISLPSQEYIDDLISRSEWASTWVMDGIEVFCWQLGPGLSDDPRVLEFRDRFPNAKHFISSPDGCPNRLSFSAAAANSIRLSRIAPEQFKIPIHDNVSAIDRQNQSFVTSDTPKASKFIPAIPRLRVQVAPAYKMLEEAAPLLNTREVVEHIPAKVLELAREGRRRIEEKADSRVSTPKLPGSDAEIITLGTGSSTPSKYRNLSGTLLRVPGYGSYLLDCGEGTLGQLRRTFEPEELEEVFKDLRMIWISHLHADHHLGTISVIRAWHEVVHGSLSHKENKVETGYDHAGTDLLSRFTQSATSDPRLAIVSHADMLNVLFEYSSAENFGFNKCLPMKTVLTTESGRQHETLVAIAPERFSTQKIVPSGHAIYNKCLGLQEISFCRVSHCHGAMAVSLEFANGFKASYSGDCRPSKRFAEIGAGSTILIHEATFDDELQGDAHAKKHSTTSEAIGVGAAMGAKAVILTHFSQRYQKTPVMSTLHPLQVDFEDATADPGTAEELAGLNGNDNSNSGTVEGVQRVPDVPLGDAEFEPVNIAAVGPETEKQEHNGPTLSTYVDAAITSTRMTAIPSSDMKVCVAFDYMRIRVDEVADMEQYTPAFVELFNDEVKSESSDSEGDSVAKSSNSPKKKDKNQEQKGSNNSSSKSKDTSTNGKKKQTPPPPSKSEAKGLTQEKNNNKNNKETDGRLSQAQLRRERKRLAEAERKAAAAAEQRSSQPTQLPNQLKRKSSSSPPSPPAASSPRRTVSPPSHRPIARSPRPAQPPSQPPAGSWDSLNDMVAQQIREDERDVVRGASEGRGVQA